MEGRGRKSFWCVVALFLLVDTCSGALVGRSRGRRDIGDMLGGFLTADDVTQMGYVASAIELMEDEVVDYFGDLTERQGAQDRILLENVQNLIFAVQTLADDPTQTPSALGALATNPSSLLLMGALVVSTVIVSQVSAFALVGETLADTGTENRGIIGMLLGLINRATRTFNSVAETKIAIEEEGSGEGSADYDYEDEGSGDVEAVSDGGILESLVSIIRSVIGVRQSDEDYDDEEGSGEEGSGGGISFGVDIEPGSFLDMVFNIIPGRIAEDQAEEEEHDDDYAYVYDDDMDVVLEDDHTDGGSSIGAVSISLHPIDLAELFVQVQQTIMENTMGMNCTCSEEMMTDERITDATLRIIEENSKRKREESSGVRLKKKGRKNQKKGGSLRKRVPKSLPSEGL